MPENVDPGQRDVLFGRYTQIICPDEFTDMFQCYVNDTVGTFKYMMYCNSVMKVQAHLAGIST